MLARILVAHQRKGRDLSRVMTLAARGIDDRCDVFGVCDSLRVA